MTEIPKSWTPVTIGDLCSFESGTGFGPANWSTSGLPIIRIQNLNGSKDFNYFSGEPEPSWIVEPGELLFAWAGVKGVSFGPTIWAGQRGVLNQHIYRIRPKPGVRLEWLYLQLLAVTASIEANAHGFKSNLVHVRKADITRQVCYLPPPKEQDCISGLMSAWDRGIRQLTDLISAKDRFKRGLMQHLMNGKRRFPEFASRPFVESQVGDVLVETFRPVKWSDDELYRLASVRRHSGGLFWREALYGKQIKVKKLHDLCEGDFLISHIQAAYGAMGLVTKEFAGGKVSDMYTILTPKDPARIDMRYIGYLSEMKRMRHQAYLACNGFFAERLRLNFDPSEFMKQRILLPESREEQSKIVDVLDSLVKELAVLEAQLDRLRQQKRGLMQKLLTGQVRVKLPKGDA